MAIVGAEAEVAARLDQIAEIGANDFTTFRFTTDDDGGSTEHTRARLAARAACRRLPEEGGSPMSRVVGGDSAALNWRTSPVVHFTVIGAVLFVLVRGTEEGASEATPPERIEVSAGEVARLRDDWARRWAEPPTVDELAVAVDEHVRTEVLYREALALGLDRGDLIVRRRLAQIMEFLLDEGAAVTQPTEADVRRHFEAQPDAYRQPARVSFSHSFFSERVRGTRAVADAARALAWIASNPGLDLRESGDPFIGGNDLLKATASDVAANFGDAFAAEIFRIEPGAWRGPVESRYGFHVVRVSERTEPQLPALHEVHEEVRNDVRAARTRAANEAAYRKIRDRYEVVVDRLAIARTAEEERK